MNKFIKRFKQVIALMAMAFFVLEVNAQQREVTVGLNPNQMAPSLVGQDPIGQTRSLSDLKGKLVLIDFWASWCMPCRYENPNVVKAYNEYKDKSFKVGEGFEVFSVSLDMKQDAWMKAIEADKLTWENHVCDFGGWQSQLSMKYGIRSIPSNFLIDGNGIIIIKDLRGEALEAVLKQLLKE